MTLEHLPWDSDFFGFQVARLQVNAGASMQELEQRLDESKQQNVRLVYVMTQDSILAEAITQLKPSFQDEKVWFSQSLKPSTLSEVSLVSCLGQPLRDSLFELALQAGHESRFHLDPQFDRKAFPEMYRIWMERSLSGERSWEVLCVQEGEQVVGFVTLDRDDDAARTNIGLIAVDKAHRGKGYGKVLMEGAKQAASAQGYQTLGVPTQRSNAGACRYYVSVGFTEESNTFIFHFWHHGN
ncbi:MAG: GNAT family N-acetyltransferase [Bacteroidota bacterium]